jgi:hypothetical protein
LRSDLCSYLFEGGLAQHVLQRSIEIQPFQCSEA